MSAPDYAPKRSRRFSCAEAGVHTCGLSDQLSAARGNEEERGVEVDHSTLNRWVVKYVPLLDQQFRTRKCLVGSSWRLDETYVKVKGSWKYLYRAVDKTGATVTSC